MEDKISPDVVNAFLQNAEHLVKFFGINDSTAKVWITILLSSDPLSQKEIANKTGFSLSLISPTLKTLERMNLIEKTEASGKNRKYKASKTLADAFLMILLQYKNTQLQEFEEKIKGMMKNKENANIEEIQNLKKESELLISLIDSMIKKK